MPVVRFETVRRDRTLSNFYLNQGKNDTPVSTLRLRRV